MGKVFLRKRASEIYISGDNGSKYILKNVLSNLTFRDFSENAGQWIRLGRDIFDSIGKMAEKPQPFVIIKESLNIVHTLVSQETGAMDFFWNGGWIKPFGEELDYFIIGLIRSLPYRTIKTSDRDCSVRITQIEGEEIGWVSYAKGTNDSLFVRPERLDEARKCLSDLMWNHFEGCSILMRKSKKQGDNGEIIVLEKDDKIPPLPSEEAKKLTTYLKRCIDAEVNRSIMFYGPPGTGKSTLTRELASNLGLRSFRIRVEDIATMDTSIVYEAISVFKPDAIILDDLDRAYNIVNLLELIDDMKRSVKLLMSTVNDKKELGDAMLRPGRFDELIELRYLDSEVIKKILGEKNLHLFHSVKKWPIVYIEELVTRRRFMNEEDAMKSLDELQKRVNKLQKYIDDEDELDENSSSVLLEAEPVLF